MKVYAVNYCDPVERRQRRREIFPAECRQAFALGARLAGSVAG